MIRALDFEALCERNVPLSLHCSFATGGEADYFALPETVEELQFLLDSCKAKGISCYIYGYGSNILFPDHPAKDQLFISLKRLIDSNIAGTQGEAKLFLSAGVPLSFLSMIGILCNYERLYFTHLLPGSVGAGVYMNAKCYDDQMSGIINRVYYINISNGSQAIQSIAAEDCEFAYKKSIFQKRPWIIVGADFMIPNLTHDRYELVQEYLQSYKNPGAEITELGAFYQHFDQKLQRICKEQQIDLPNRFLSIMDDRNSKHHFSYPSCGSVFKNNYDFGTPMGVLVDRLQLKGKVYGGAMISPHHGNFIVNYNNATSADIAYLIAYIQEAINNEYGFVPEPEVVIVQGS